MKTHIIFITHRLCQRPLADPSAMDFGSATPRREEILLDPPMMVRQLLTCLGGLGSACVHELRREILNKIAQPGGEMEGGRPASSVSFMNERRAHVERAESDLEGSNRFVRRQARS